MQVFTLDELVIMRRALLEYRHAWSNVESLTASDKLKEAIAAAQNAPQVQGIPD